MNRLRRIIDHVRLPGEARKALRRDRALQRHLPDDPGIPASVAAMLDWLVRAQDCSATGDGGIARHYSLLTGWGPSYPETTGYIVPTLLAAGERTGDQLYAERARQALDWLVALQMENGAFQGGPVGVAPVPVSFNTGQILLGLVTGQRAFGGYEAAVSAAAGFLVEAQDDDGCWRRFPSPFAQPGDKAYDAHVAYALFEADTVYPGNGYGEAAVRNLDWVLTRQQADGWLDDCCLNRPATPLTHTLGYAIKGLMEGYRSRGENRYLEAAHKTARQLLGLQRVDGALPGRIGTGWTAAVPWTCLTGNAQIAEVWLMLFEDTGEQVFLDAARAANAFGRRCLMLGGLMNTSGGVSGSFPIDGDYGRFEYLSWAVKFSIDSNILEAKVNPN